MPCYFIVTLSQSDKKNGVPDLQAIIINNLFTMGFIFNINDLNVTNFYIRISIF